MVYILVYEMVYRGVGKNGGVQNIMETSALRIIFMFLTLVLGLLFIGTVTLAMTRFVRSTHHHPKPRQHATFPCDPWRESGRRLHGRPRP
ncbi:MAG: hypothetical protein CMJ37_03470 [Phycisphaerae bacterium]|nr:hypothetical protein [Phycisphaerae bacterium]